MKNNSSIRAAALAAISLASAGSLHASEIILGDAGVDLGRVDSGLIYNALTVPVNSVYTKTWTTAGSGFATFVAPVGQFTGFKDDGSLVLPQDLIPLRTTSITIVDPITGAPITVIDKNNPVVGATGPKGDPGPAYSEIIQIQSPSTSFTSLGQDITFGTNLLALESPNNLYTYTPTSITLKPGHTYKLHFSNTYSQCNFDGNIAYQFFNQTSGQFFGVETRVVNHVEGAFYALAAGDITAFITPTVPTTISIRTTRFGNLGGIENPNLIVESVR